MNKKAEDLSGYVRRIMKVKGLTQKDVQQLSGGKITDGYVASIITGRAKNLSVEKIQALAVGLGVDTDELFHVACGGATGSPQRKGIISSDALAVVELLQKLVVNPDLNEIVEEVMRLKPDERTILLLSIKRLKESGQKQDRKVKPS